MPAGLRTLPANPASELHVLGVDGHALGMNRAEVGVLKEAHEIGFGSLLKCLNRQGLKPEVRTEIARDLTNQTLEWTLADEELRALLVPTDLTQRNGARAVPVCLDRLAGAFGCLPGRLSGQCPTRGLASHALACGLLCACHFFVGCSWRDLVFIFTGCSKEKQG